MKIVFHSKKIMFPKAQPYGLLVNEASLIPNKRRIPYWAMRSIVDCTVAGEDLLPKQH